MDSTLVMPRYEAPALEWPGELGQRQEIIWWVVFVGFAYALALLYAWYCDKTRMILLQYAGCGVSTTVW